MRRRYFCTVFIIVSLFVWNYMRMPEYNIYTSYINERQNYRDTEIHVIVYKPWDTMGTIGRIEAKYNMMNGIPNTLTLWLYHSLYDLDHGQAYYSITLEYREDEITEPPPAL